MFRSVRARLRLLVLVVSTTGGSARAQPAPPTIGDELIELEGAAPGESARDRERSLGSAPFVAVLHPDAHPASATVAEALVSAAGVQMRSLGSFGAYQAISVRGAAAGHTSVLVDGVPLARLAAVTTDLGRYALDAFGAVELYRGAVPVELGGAGVGGAVNLVTRLGRGASNERVRAVVGVGSYGARFARARFGDSHGDGRLLSSATLGYQGATGDFSYFNDRGTPLNPADDRLATRRNNGFDQVDGAARIGDRAGTRAAGLRLAWRTQGLPGGTTDPTFTAELGTVNALADARADVVAGPGTVRVLGYGLVERQRLADAEGELGLGRQARRYTTLAAGTPATWRVPLGPHRATAGLELRGERFRDGDASGMRAAMLGSRGASATAASIDLALGDAIVVTPAARFELVRTAPTPMGEGPDAFMAVPPRWDAVPSPRISARARLREDLALKGSTGSYVRLPTLLELFGDRGAVLGSPDLAIERGTASDAGLVWAPAGARGAIDRILLEVTGFATRAEDTIALVSSVGAVSRALNIGATQTYGSEVTAGARVGRLLAVTTSYTRLVSEQRTRDPNRFGKALPRTPGHILYARADLARRIGTRRASAYLEIAAQSTSYLDQANLLRVPLRALVGAGLRCDLRRGFALALTVANALDTRVVELPADRPQDSPLPAALADLAGFPLPGRAFTASVDWTY